MTNLSNVFGKLIELIAVLLLVALAVIVVTAVVFRYVLNDSLPWYDELASVLLAWITYFGGALAALRRAHLGFSAFVLSLPTTLRAITFLVSEAVTYTVFISLAWAGWRVLAVMEGMSLEALPSVSLQLVQSIVPIGCTLFVIAQLLSTPVAWNRLVEGRDREQDEIDSEIAKAEAEIARMPRGGSQ
jgi:TRAP-type C4-dicarboxylate transport system permease small subunit